MKCSGKVFNLHKNCPDLRIPKQLYQWHADKGNTYFLNVNPDKTKIMEMPNKLRSQQWITEIKTFFQLCYCISSLPFCSMKKNVTRKKMRLARAPFYSISILVALFTWTTKMENRGHLSKRNTSTTIVKQSQETKTITGKREIYNLLQTCDAGKNNERAFWANCLIKNYCKTENNLWKVLPGATLTEYSDGSADIKLTLQNISKSDFQFIVTGIFSGRTNKAPQGSPKEGLCVGNVDNADWYYYTNFQGTMMGEGSLKGAELSITPMGPAFQMGTAAGLTNTNYGGAMWLNYTIVKQPSNTSFQLQSGSGMDFNFGLTPDCTSRIDKLVLYEVGSFKELTVLENGKTYNLGQLPRNFGMEAIVNGSVGSIGYEVNGAKIVENYFHYTYPSGDAAWIPEPGTYRIKAKLFSKSKLSGAFCDEVSLTVHFTGGCDNFTDGGEIGFAHTSCDNPYDPGMISSVRLPSGGSGEIEYMWLKSTKTCDPPRDLNDSRWEIIDGAYEATLDPGPITESTCFLRCSRRMGCEDFVGESNIIRMELMDAPDVEINAVPAICDDGEGSIEFEFENHASRTNIEFSIDGGQTYPLYVEDKKKYAVYENLAPGEYHVFVRWGNDECPVDLGTVVVPKSDAIKVEVNVNHPECGKQNGNVELFFDLKEKNSILEFSCDGGKNFPIKVTAKTGYAVFKNLGPGVYHLKARWKKSECPVDLGSIELIDATGPLVNAGQIEGDESNCGAYQAAEIIGEPGSGGFGGEIIYQWQEKNGNKWENIEGATSQNYNPGWITESRTFRRLAKRNNSCGDWKISNQVQKLFQAIPNISFSVVNPACGKPNGEIVFEIDNKNVQANLEFSNNGGQSFKLYANKKNETVAFTRLKAGIYNLVVRLNNDACPLELGQVELLDEEAPISDPGKIEAVESICANNQSGLITGTPAIGGVGGEVVYKWQQNENGKWKDIDGANNKDYDPGILEKSASFRRLAKRNNNCSDWLASNIVKISLLEIPAVVVETKDGDCDKPGEITFKFSNVNNRTEIEFSLDGGLTYELKVQDNSKSAKVENLMPGDYHLFVRWGNDDCPVDLGIFNIEGPDDVDKDGVCADRDCNDHDALIPAQPGTSCDDLNPETINDVIQEDGCSCAGTKEIAPCAFVVNYAKDKPTFQSSIGYSGSPARAVDGNTNGNYSHNSVTHTNNEKEAFWEVDLLKVEDIQYINIWNRTDCCADRLKDFYVLVSSEPFLSNDLNTTIAQSGVIVKHIEKQCESPTRLELGAEGRYVRIQLAGKNFLSLAEVEIMGCVSDICEFSALTGSIVGNEEICAGTNAILSVEATANCQECCTRTVSNTVKCNDPNSLYQIYLSYNGGAFHFPASEATWEECSDGTARYTAIASANGDIIKMDVTFSGKTNTPPSGSPKSNSCQTIDPSNWHYYTAFNGTIASNLHGNYTISRRGPAFQVGENANQTATGFGASGWFTLSGGDGYYQVGDINIMLSEPICLPSNDLTYLWSTGANTPTIEIAPLETTAYSVTVTDCNGCTITDEFTVNVLPDYDQDGDCHESCEVKACKLKLDLPEILYACEYNYGVIQVSASELEAGVVPPGYKTVFVLTDGDGLRIEMINDYPVFPIPSPIKGNLKCRIHCLVYNPAVVDLESVIEFGVTTIFELVDRFAVEGWCADVDLEGAVFQILQCASVGNYVWNDLNKNGIQETGEPGLPNVVVQLLNETGKMVSSTTTNSFGKYGFYDLVPGNYKIAVQAPVGFVGSPKQSSGNPQTDSDIDLFSGITDLITLNEEDFNMNYDAGFYEFNVCDLSTLSGKITGEEEICAGTETVLSVEATSNCEDCCTRIVSNTVKCNDPNSLYQIYLTYNGGASHFPASEATWEECSDGTAHYTATAAAGGDVIKVDVTFTGKTNTAPSGSPKANDCGSFDPSNWVYYPSFSGTIESSLHGKFTISRRGPAFQLGEGANQTASGFGACGWLTLTGGDGYYKVGDINIMLSEPICLPSNNLTYLWSTGANTPTIEVAPLESTIYSVTVTDCYGCTITDDFTVNVLPDYDQDGDCRESCEVRACKMKLDLDEILYSCDYNYGVIQVSASELVPGVVPPGYKRVFLLTDGDILRIEMMDDYPVFPIQSPIKGDLKCRIHCFVYNPDQIDLASIIEFGTTTVFDLADLIDAEGWCADADLEGAVFQVLQCAAVGDFVWDDLNANGLQDQGEPGLAGIGVQLYDQAGTIVRSTVTNSSGKYGFYDLRPGDYRIHFDKPANYVGTTKNVNGNASKDSDAGHDTGMTNMFTLHGDEFLNQIDAGFYSINICNPYCEIEIDGPSEYYLCQMTTPSQLITVKSTGNDIIPNGYSVLYIVTEGSALNIEKFGAMASFEIPKPQPGVCHVHCLVYDGNPSSENFFNVTGWMNSNDQKTLVDLQNAMEMADVCYYMDMDGARFEFIDCPFVGGVIFNDLNRNGIKDASEPGVRDVVINALNAADMSLVSSAKTSSSGRYGFHVMSGDYIFQVIQPVGYEFSPLNVGTDFKKDSNFDPVSGLSAVKNLVDATSSDIYLDCGLMTILTAQYKAPSNSVTLGGVSDYVEGGVPALTPTNEEAQTQFNSDWKIALEQNRPNPFREMTKIGFVLPNAGNAVIQITDMTGRLILEKQGDFTKGYNEITIERGHLPSGLLHYTLISAEGRISKTMLILEQVMSRVGEWIFFALPTRFQTKASFFLQDPHYN